VNSYPSVGRQLATLRDAIPSNQKFGRAVRKQFDLHDPLHVAEMARVARLYGARPDVTRRVRNWRVLAALSGTMLSESARRAFEAQILAGEVVTAKSIAAHASGAERKSGRRRNDAEIIRARFTQAGCGAPEDPGPSPQSMIAAVEEANVDELFALHSSVEGGGGSGAPPREPKL
jgi:hypothetical protein